MQNFQIGNFANSRTYHVHAGRWPSGGPLAGAGRPRAAMSTATGASKNESRKDAQLRAKAARLPFGQN